MIDLVKLHEAATHAQVEGYLMRWNGSEIRQLVDQLQAAQKDAARYRWLAPRLMAADFDWQDSGKSALIFDWPKNVAVGGTCDQNIDAAIEADRASNGGTA